MRALEDRVDGGFVAGEAASGQRHRGHRQAAHAEIAAGRALVLELRFDRTVEKWSVHPIAQHLGVHHATVRRTLCSEGLADPVQPRISISDPFVPFMKESLLRYPDLTAARLLHMVRERGYVGGPSHFRAIVSRLRPRPSPEAFLRRHTLPGEEAQVDWAYVGKLPVPGGDGACAARCPEEPAPKQPASKERTRDAGRSMGESPGRAGV